MEIVDGLKKAYDDIMRAAAPFSARAFFRTSKRFCPSLVLIVSVSNSAPIFKPPFFYLRTGLSIFL